MDSWQLWNQALEWCKELGIKVMIDIHSAETHAAGHNFALWFNDKYSTEDLYDSLSWFADYYKNDDTLLAIDIKNEPHGTADTPNDMAKWDDSEDVNNWKYVAETAGKRILEQNPNLLIVIEGVEVYPKEGYDWTAPKIEWTTMTTFYHGTLWGANLRGVRKDPIDLGSAAANSKIVYSPHDYGPKVFEQTWFYEGFTQESLMKDCWYDNWAYIYEEGIAPLLIGEWGGFMDGDRNEQWMVYLRDYIKANHIHHTFWCFNENSGDTGVLVKENFGEWDEEKYALVKPTLWQTENGAFISLDHQVPLGANGISLGDYNRGEVGMTTPVGGTATTTTPIPVQGDANRDGKLNALDILILKQHFISHATVTAEEWEEADFDENGEIELADLIGLVHFVLNID